MGKLELAGKWNLPGGIAPSAMALVFENAGDMLACELSRETCLWRELPTGQRLVYERFVTNGCARNLAAVCKHNVAPEFGRKIDTRNDIVGFQLMVYVEGERLAYSDVREDWASFVENEFYGSRKAFSEFVKA